MERLIVIGLWWMRTLFSTSSKISKPCARRKIEYVQNDFEEFDCQRIFTEKNCIRHESDEGEKNDGCSDDCFIEYSLYSFPFFFFIGSCFFYYKTRVAEFIVIVLLNDLNLFAFQFHL